MLSGLKELQSLGYCPGNLMTLSLFTNSYSVDLCRFKSCLVPLLCTINSNWGSKLATYTMGLQLLHNLQSGRSMMV
jgi:hypothetical protein